MKSVNKIARFFFLGIFFYALVASASPIPKEIRKEAKNQPSFELLLKNPESFKNHLVLLGGVIIENTPLEDRTELLIEHRKLGSSGRPKYSTKNKKRFSVVTKDFLDPEIYAQGRFITVYGKVGSLQKGKEKQLLVYAKFIYLWPEDFIPSSGWYMGIGPGFFF
ncbi:hypothetical protein A7K93_09010 [Candidatus Methylacidiphilum fumarolicum]|uniref:Starvation-inducible outer membrane lipoprotein n=2 Tax=Candidatus Methylacidiphilum fumarolicum TaxID=591154 RepID=A0ABM9IFE9_9BACT|nr:Slp family lipoprotein [Candidatus Methylacidiphilum fumarolicum]MBW6415272.1 Slp family lipoprotein [Candidatus Methylacidiphilum fumarolicum]TFE69252.1 hypothetical protein A7K73_06230 [Candidatus Methylacidiphilum fumarolicum]TFE72223.1 hypothetical protein A7K72_09270 [Candidatus Methylacidiphilum fumarolicum]TFE72364.1 hypothetical protein A7K93_09010 [Candidatus Methylacidiphilum fumarolicum]TFE76978.1 hypothetical protein A7D33_07145 [Candidatus Methylacidiphilum fumarolicum]